MKATEILDGGQAETNGCMRSYEADKTQRIEHINERQGPSHCLGVSDITGSDTS